MKIMGNACHRYRKRAANSFPRKYSINDLINARCESPISSLFERSVLLTNNLLTVKLILFCEALPSLVFN